MVKAELTDNGFINISKKHESFLYSAKRFEVYINNFKKYEAFIEIDEITTTITFGKMFMDGITFDFMDGEIYEFNGAV
jgi:hypothetical protein